MFGNQFGEQYSGMSGGNLFTKALTEVVNATEVFLKRTTKILSSVVNATGVFVRTTSKRFSSTVNAVESSFSVLKVAIKILTDTIIAVDVIQTAFATLIELVDTVVTADLLIVAVIFRRVLTDSVVVAETITKAITRTLTDTVSTLEKYIMRLNGILLKWINTIRTTGSWSNKGKSSGTWTDTAKPE